MNLGNTFLFLKLKSKREKKNPLGVRSNNTDPTFIEAIFLKVLREQEMLIKRRY